MRNQGWMFSALVFLLLSWQAYAETFVLKVLTYNIQGLPFGVDQSRYRKIGRILGEEREIGIAPHLVGIQEAFASRTSELLRHSGYPYVARGPRAAVMRTSSGLAILSEFPIQEASTRSFRECGGTDCFAKKGVVRARVSIPSVPFPIDLYNTHLNSSYEKFWPGEKAGERIRIKQVREMSHFIASGGARSVPAIFVGDFNFRSGGIAFSFFQDMSRMGNAAAHCIDYGCEGDRDVDETWPTEVDHQFFRLGSPGHSALRMTPIHYERVFHEPVDGKRLSDHLGVLVHYLLEW